MRCIWSTAATSVLRRSTYKLHNEPGSKKLFHNCVNTRSSKTTKTRYFSHNISHNRSAHAAALHAPVVTEQIHTTHPELSDAQASRAASQVVRVFCKHGELRNAYFVVNSLRSSNPSSATFSDPPPNDTLNNLLNDYDLLDFGRHISPRLSCHALLHGLLRAGCTKKAEKLAEMMMEDGIRLHSRSLQAIVRSMTDAANVNASSNLRPALTLLKGHFNRPSNALDISPKTIRDPCLSFAVRVVLEARNYRQRRTKDMYEALIKACILQGEIIVASILLVLAVKDWQLRSAAAAATVDVPTASAQPDITNDIAPFPPQASMNDLLLSIENGITRYAADDGESSKLIMGAYLQSLANIASLLDQKQLPFSQMSTLIRILMRCPRLGYEVWIERKGTRLKVDAYEYFHGILKNLVKNLPSSEKCTSTKKQKKEGHSMLPPLDRHSYNTLLTYALRHRFSVPLASGILRHMENDRHFSPSISTYNTLLRSGTLMQENSIAEGVLKQLRLEQKVQGRWLEPLKGVDPSTFKTRDLIPATARSNKAIPDAYTLSSYISHLTSTGNPNAVAELLFRLIPELVIIQHPSWGELSKEERLQLKIESREAALRRAVEYGPYVFTTLLNALTKAGRTGLAERVWFLAKEAERASWSGLFTEDGESPSQPWCLPIQAYTIMLQCYAAESRKGMLLLNRRTQRDPSRCADALNDGHDWQATPTSKRYVRGWAKFVVFRNSLQNKGINMTRSQAARLMSTRLVNSMRDGAQQVFSAMASMQREQGHHMSTRRAMSKHVQIPRPDARFFNAALDVFGRQSGMRMRRARKLSKSHWHRHSRNAEGWYVRFWIKSKHWHPFLRELAECMHETGHSVPHGFRHLFLGRYTPATQPLPRDCVQTQLQSIVRPYRFPKRVKLKFKPFTLQTVKERGLPVRKLRRRSQRRRRAS